MVSRKTGIHPSGRGPKACFWGMLFRIMLLDRLRAEGRAPMRQSVLQHAVPDIAQRLLVEPLDDFHCEGLGPMRGPRRLQGRVRAVAMPPGEPQPVLDAIEVRRPAEPPLAEPRQTTA